jgi:hypothetical protein
MAGKSRFQRSPGTDAPGQKLKFATDRYQVVRPADAMLAVPIALAKYFDPSDLKCVDGGLFAAKL